MTPSTRKVIRQYYVYCALFGTWFASGIWIFFARKYATDTAIGFFDAASFAVALLAEIPSGVLADRIGRRKTVIIGTLIYGVGYTMWGLSISRWMMAVSFIVYWVGGSFVSGADEAMIFEYLKSKGHEDLWQRISVNRFLITRVSLILSIFFGGLMYNVYGRLPFLARGFTFFLMLIPLYWLRSVDAHQPQRQEKSNFIADIKTGTRELLSAKIVWVLPLYLMVQGIGFTVFTSGILRPILFAYSGISLHNISSFVALTTLISVTFLFVSSRYFKKSFFRLRTIFLLAITMIVGFLLNIPHNTFVAIAGLALVTLAAYSLSPLLSNAINTTIGSRYRATTLSAANFCENILYVVLAPIVGYLSTKGSINNIIYLCSGMVLIGLLSSLYLHIKAHV